ncbi:MAG: hypothetical protein ACE5FP_09705 [Gemmatimonadota bacterium]
MNDKYGRARLVFAFALLAWLAAYAYWSLHSEVNWDEFSLLARASDSLREGRLLGGGRPGLGTLVLMPLVRECNDAVSAVRLARLSWAPFSIGIMVGLWLVLRRLFSGRDQADAHALMGVLLLVLTPNFLRFVVQVRTDQPAIAMGLLGGVALVGTRRRIPMSALAGVLFGVGYLFSQKLVYVAALVSLLAAADLLLKEDFRWRRELGRAVAVICGFFAVLAVFRVTVSLLWQPPSVTNIGGQMDVFRYYRETFGYLYYRRMLPGLLGPIALLGVQLVLIPAALRRGAKDRLTGLLSISVLGLGMGVAVFHAGAFPYFWMTLGLFPAAALAVGLPLVLRLPKWTKRSVFGLFWTLFLPTAVMIGVFQARDGQATQRASMAFVRANIPPRLDGFHATRALFCHNGDDPLPTFFSQNIQHRFGGDGGEEAIDQLIAEFRQRPIGFLINTWRLEEFPDRMRRFWADHYVPYSGAVHVAGTSLDETDPPRVEFEVIVPGEYAFHPSHSRSRIRIGAARLGKGDRIRLDPGVHTIDRTGLTGSAVFSLSLPTPPGDADDTFYRVF